MNDLPAVTEIPQLMVLRNILEDILGRDVEVVVSGPWSPSPGDPGAVAVYVDDRGQLRAFISCDLPMAVALGASIALVPARVAAECVTEGQLTGDIAENLNEVLNILAAMFNLPEHPHVKLYELHAPGAHLTGGLVQMLQAFGRREDLTLDVAGYGGGRLSLVVV